MTANSHNEYSILTGRTALIVIDITRDSLSPASDSGIALEGAPQAIDNARRVVDAARENGVPVIWIQELHRPSGIDFGRELDGAETVHCVEGAPGSRFIEDFAPRADEFYVPKRRYSAFFATDLEILLKGLKVETLILVGFLTDVCVHYTGADAHQHDYRIRVVREAVAGSSVAAHEASLNALEYLQSGAVVSVDAMTNALNSYNEYSMSANSLTGAQL